MTEVRLIDANALKEEVNKKNVVGRFNTLLLIDNAPTVEEVSIVEFKEPLPLVKAQKIIRALNKIPQGDLISREALLEAIRKRLGISSLNFLTEQERVVVEEIFNAPTISNHKEYGNEQ